MLGQLRQVVGFEVFVVLFSFAFPLPPWLFRLRCLVGRGGLVGFLGIFVGGVIPGDIRGGLVFVVVVELLARFGEDFVNLLVARFLVVGVRYTELLRCRIA